MFPSLRFSRVQFAVVIAALLILPHVASSQTITYSLGASSNLLDADFYVGKAAPGSPVVESPGGRTVFFFSVNNAGTKAILWAIDLGTLQQDLFMVNIGAPSSWQRLTHLNLVAGVNPVVWCADDRHVFTRPGGIFDTQTNVLTLGRQIAGSTYDASSITRRATDNWMLGRPVSPAARGIIPAYPVLDNGDADPSRIDIDVPNYRAVTNFSLGVNETVGGSFISREGNSVVFSIEDQSGAPDIANIYRLDDVNAILDGTMAPPANLLDSRIAEIRTSSTPNYVCCGVLSFDNSVVLFSEDYANVFDLQDFFSALAMTDFDIGYTSFDGTGHVRLMEPAGQGALNPFPTGNRLHYLSATATPGQANVFATTLVAANDIDTETDPIPGEGTNDTIVGGNPVTVPFILTDSVVATTTPVTVADASGTVIDLPVDQVINYPTGTAVQEITIFTPIDPVAPIELPDPQTGIPVIRTFGPSGTQFEPPITITITYTDGEVASLADESTMIPYLYNTGTLQFEPLDSLFLPSVVVDTVNNTLSFQTDHFSIYGIGGEKAPPPPVPQRPWTWVVLVAVLMGFAGFSLARRRVGRTSSEIR